ncbi:hypothetical protein HDC36_003632 [Xanthomonas sp. JAI131]|uniref:hypothetical protein n=1 Tax=Xanthomonas sp. JAI131 TaxID=2723067 RepID=UPI0015C7F757|nr:hypothetical protein [Xanthomonas sp. JAI131]NYF22156.1 hypothetical protein [Xanthomonas sp. JAI131]
MVLNKFMRDALWNGELSVCFFILGGGNFWVIDDKVNFSLDAEKNYKAYLDRGYIDKYQYEAACREFRGGVLRLNSDNFKQYLASSSAKIFSRSELEEFFFDSDDSRDELLDELEMHYMSGAEISSDCIRDVNLLSSMLPSFYVNFDRRIYMHMDGTRSHEELAYSDWIAKNGDFSFLIPDLQRYWLRRSRDYWKVKFLSS